MNSLIVENIFVSSSFGNHIREVIFRKKFTRYYLEQIENHRTISLFVFFKFIHSMFVGVD